MEVELCVMSKVILFSLQYLVSTLSYPTPCLAITFKFLQSVSISEFRTPRLNAPSYLGKTLKDFSPKTSNKIYNETLFYLSKSMPLLFILSIIPILNIHLVFNKIIFFFS